MTSCLHLADWRRAPVLLLLAASAGAQSLVPGGAPSAKQPGERPAQVAPAPPKPPQPPQPPQPRRRLDVGDPAPTLEGLQWLKGEPVTEWKPGTTYVVEFWAPWCPWCRESLPIYAGIARGQASKPVQVVAVAVWPKKSQPGMAPDYVADQAEQFPYPVAADVSNRAAKAWLDAADVLIPTAFVVNGEGRIAWLGDPRQGLEKSLGRLVGEPPRTETAEQVRRAWNADVEEEKALKLVKAKDWKELAELSRSLYDGNPWVLPDQAVYHYIALVMQGEEQAAKDWGERLLTKDFAGQFNGLNILAWYIVDPGGAIPPEKQDLDLALRAARRADMLTGHDNAYILDTLARVLYLRGELAEALHLQVKAVGRAATLDTKDAPQIRRELAERLAEYEAAADEAASRP